MAKKEGFVGSYVTRNAGKGDRPRPLAVSKDEYDRNHERIFGPSTRPSQPSAADDTVEGAPMMSWTMPSRKD